MTNETQHLAGEAPCIKPLGDGAATVVFGATMATEIHARVRGLDAALGAAHHPAISEWAPAFASLTVWYDPDMLGFDALADLLLRLSASAAPAPAGAAWALPFCCDADFAPDLADTAAQKGFSPEAYIDAFCGLTFEAIMLGFLPGFAYLGGLPETLSAPRLKTPRKGVPAGSVAVADGMCAAYPSASPGGWRLIGRTPAPLFDARNAERPVLIAPGDRLRWRRVTRQEFLTLEARWAQNFDAASLREAP